MPMGKWQGLVIAIAWFILIVVITNTLLNLADNSLAKNVLTIGLCIVGIIGIPFVVNSISK